MDNKKIDIKFILPRKIKKEKNMYNIEYCPVCDKEFSTYNTIGWVYNIADVKMCSYTCYRIYIKSRAQYIQNKYSQETVPIPSYIKDFLKYMHKRYNNRIRVAIILRIGTKGINSLYKTNKKNISIIDLKCINDFIIKHKHHPHGFTPTIKRLK